AAIWLDEVGIAPARFARIGAADNFWAMGDTGPCGPCSEIFYDHGPEIPGGPPGSVDADGDRFVEIWNLVFMQYNRDGDGSLTDLPKPSVDTGMGLERLAAVMAGTHDNYATDLFQGLMAAAAAAVGCANDGNPSLRVIADHIRSSAFLIADGVLPANEGRGYVLRRIMRRALRHGHKLGAQAAFFYKLVAPLVEEMGQAYPELAAAAPHVEKVIAQEEARFADTLNQGMALLEDAIAGLSGATLDGATVFKLYDTYGFPADLTADVARERGLRVDQAGFDRAMAGQRERARAAGRFKVDYAKSVPVSGSTEFTGYAATEGAGRVLALLRDGAPVDRIGAGEAAVVVLDATPFYAESGGQVGDTGLLEGRGALFEVADTQKADGRFLHIGHVQAGELAVGDALHARADAARRRAIELNHSATHLVHAALREVLGTHVGQKGSLVAPDRLRFDFSHYEAVPADLLGEIEYRVNEQIRADIAGEFYEKSYDEAIAEGALAFFGEKYGDRVRVVRYGDYSVELCGGTHVARSGEIGLFKFSEERGVAAGVRRIEAVTGNGALDWVRGQNERLQRLSAQLKAAPAEAEAKLEKTLERLAELERQLGQLGARLASTRSDELAAQAADIGGVRVLAARLDAADRKALRETMDTLKIRLVT
ncbi:MAG: alanine--tRNA ligase, partial [Salinisphaera sp.]|nr:alanine--tRNA ligase [Salinisphaera sp.]